MSHDLTSPDSNSSPSNTANAALGNQFLPGLFEPLQPSTVGVLAWTRGNYLTRKRAEGGKESGLSTLLTDIAFAEEYFRLTYQRELRFCDLSAAFVEDFMAWRANQKRVNSPETVNRSRNHLLSVWNDAASRRMCYAPPPRGVKKYKVAKHLPEAWSDEEMGAILGAARDCRWNWEKPKHGAAAAERWSPPPVPASLWLSTIILTLYWTGARKTALLTTPVGNLDLRLRLARSGELQGSVFIPAAVQKQNADQRKGISEEVCQMWAELDVHGRGLKRLGDDWPYDRHPNSRWKTLNRWYARLLVIAGVVQPGESTRKQLWHKLRRTYATYVFAEHGIGEAQRQLGHSSPQVTERYIDTRFTKEVDVTKSLPKPKLPPPNVLPLRIADAS
jgi:integrase